MSTLPSSWFVLCCTVLILVYALLFAWALKRFVSVIRYRRGLRSNIELHQWNRGVQTSVFLSIVLATFGRTLCFVLVAILCTPLLHFTHLFKETPTCDPIRVDAKFLGEFGYFAFTLPGFFIDLTYILLFNLLIIVWMRTKAVQEMVSLDIVRPRLIYSTVGCCVMYLLAMVGLLVQYECNGKDSGESGEEILMTQGIVVMVMSVLAVFGVLLMHCFVQDVQYRSPYSHIRFRQVAKTFAWWTLLRFVYGIGMVTYKQTVLEDHSNHLFLVVSIIVAFFITETLPCVLIIQRSFFHVLVQIDDMEDRCEQTPFLPGHWSNRDFLKRMAHSLKSDEKMTPRDTKRLGALQVGQYATCSVTVRILCKKQLPTRYVIQECVSEASRLISLVHPNVVPLIAFVAEAPLMQNWRTQSACWIVTGCNAELSLYTYIHSPAHQASASGSLREGQSIGRRVLNVVSRWSRNDPRGFSHLVGPSSSRPSLWNALAGLWVPLDMESEDWIRTITFFQQIVDGCSYLHEQGVAHGHLTPHNILVQDDLTLRITDMGFHGLKRFESLMGTYDVRNPWSAPEILNGTQKAPTRECDVYALGLILWELITLEQPFAGLTLGAITKAVNDKQRPEPPDANTALTLALNALIHACWQHDPAQRMTSADVLVEVNDIESRFRK